MPAYIYISLYGFMGIRVEVKILHTHSLHHMCGKKKEAVKFSELFCVPRNFRFLAAQRSVQIFLVGGHSGTAFY